MNRADVLEKKKLLDAKLKALDKFPACSKHGRDRLQVCPAGDCTSVHCAGCVYQLCQCWNDE